MNAITPWEFLRNTVVLAGLAAGGCRSVFGKPSFYGETIRDRLSSNLDRFGRETVLGYSRSCGGA